MEGQQESQVGFKLQAILDVWVHGDLDSIEGCREVYARQVSHVFPVAVFVLVARWRLRWPPLVAFMSIV